MAPKRKAEFKEDQEQKATKHAQRTKTLSDEVQPCTRDNYGSLNDYQIDGKLNMAGKTLREILTEDMFDI
eukprot:1560307-Lingulodinium_polyedra.AAC.1